MFVLIFLVQRFQIILNEKYFNTHVKRVVKIVFKVKFWLIKNIVNLNSLTQRYSMTKIFLRCSLMNWSKIDVNIVTKLQQIQTSLFISYTKTNNDVHRSEFITLSTIVSTLYGAWNNNNKIIIKIYCFTEIWSIFTISNGYLRGWNTKRQ